MTPRPGRGRRHATRLRFMAEEFADFVLWGEEQESVEDRLDIPENLRRRMAEWANEYSDRRRGMAHAWTQDQSQDYDRRGYAMSKELQEVLGADYFVDYHFITATVRDEVRATEDP